IFPDLFTCCDRSTASLIWNLFSCIFFRANALFNIWIKYKPRLPEWYYNEKLLKVGDSLAQIKFHALQERDGCIYQIVCSSDRNLQNQESLQTCFNILSSLRLTMQVALPQESLCWLIYNGTIHIYTICRHLMMMGQSAKVLEYLLWASICMESSIPLLSVHYLTWRTTLYTAVSQCYFDCQDSIHGEIFARRGLIKIDELKQLLNISPSLENSKTQKIFREATLKMSIMIFKRAVYEPRRKPKSHFRSKLRVSLKEAQNLPWPRTTTERLLTEMFDGAAAQFLAILEALSDSSRHVLRPAPPVSDEVEIHDVISELFFAGLEILSGSYCTDHFGIINPSSTLLQLILTGEKGVSGDAAVKFIKLAFSYEEWDVFDSAIEFVVNFLQAQDDPTWKKAEMELKLLTLMQPLLFPKKFKHTCLFKLRFPLMCYCEGKKKKSQYCLCAEHFESVYIHSCLYNYAVFSFQNIQPANEILVDVIMFLWQKCKTGLQQIQLIGNHLFLLENFVLINTFVVL
uniref:CFA54 protein n=1 Tax=Calidris pygmaea TaxID=425635 RepID=A0A8C3JG43_9CHAR